MASRHFETTSQRHHNWFTRSCCGTLLPLFVLLSLSLPPRSRLWKRERDMNDFEIWDPLFIHISDGSAPTNADLTAYVVFWLRLNFIWQNCPSCFVVMPAGPHFLIGIRILKPQRTGLANRAEWLGLGFNPICASSPKIRLIFYFK